MAIYERMGHVSVWWFPKEFSQSRFGVYRASGTNSCTLISLILADKVAKQQDTFHRGIDELPLLAVDIFGEAINEGNRIYNLAIKLATKSAVTPEASIVIESNSGSETTATAILGTASSGGSATKTAKNPAIDDSLNLNIPDALRALKGQPILDFRLHEWFYTHLHADRKNELYPHMVAVRIMHVLRIAIHLFQESTENSEYDEASRRYLFAAMIADHRTVMFIIELPVNMITFFDSHQHGRQAGAVIAQCTFEDLYDLADWYVHMQQDIYSSQPSLYELSFLTSDQIRIPQPRKVSF